MTVFRRQIEDQLAEILDELMGEGNLEGALIVLGRVKESFSRYEYYMQRVNERISCG